MKLRATLLMIAIALIFAACQGKVSVEKGKDGQVKVKVDNSKQDTPETRFKKAIDDLELKATQQNPGPKAAITDKVSEYKAEFERVKGDPKALSALLTRVETYAKEVATLPTTSAGGKLGVTEAPAVGNKLGGAAPVGGAVAPVGTVPGGKLGGAATPPVGGKLGGAPAGGGPAPVETLPGGNLGGAAAPPAGGKLGGSPAPAGGAPAPAGMGGK